MVGCRWLKLLGFWLWMVVVGFLLGQWCLWVVGCWLFDIISCSWKYIRVGVCFSMIDYSCDLFFVSYVVGCKDALKCLIGVIDCIG